MPTSTRAKPAPRGSRSGRKSAPNGRSSGALQEVLTLSEAAAFLRVAERTVEAMTVAHAIPGQKIGAEWRYLKSALEDWLRKSSPPTGKEAMLALAGAFRDDPDLDGIVHAAYRQRRRHAMLDAS